MALVNKLTWDETLSVGVDAIDIRHKEIIREINDLREAMSGGQGGTRVGPMIAFIDDYVASHFGMEELLMKRRKYDGYIAHRQEHINFTTEFTVKKKKYETLEAEGAILSFFAVELERWLSSWLIDHLASADKALGKFLMQPPLRKEGEE